MAANDTPKNADFVQKIVSDAKNPPQTRTLTGWFGDAGTKGSRRLYTDAQLSSYVDIPADAILHSEPVKDSQPPGAVMVWVKADAQLDSSSASSRASRFLQGDLTKDLLGEGALDRGGFRCVTQPPCAEPTGFTGLCTKQPDVGGCWPCITAIPHCAEPTGFTGKCTHVPWPLPTHYAHCTVLHCPTFDLTCIPQICNVIASGIPGCAGGNPVEQGGGPQEKAGAAAANAARIPKTELLGCGFTKEWGLCQTQLLHCETISQGMEPCTKPIAVDVAARQGGGGGGAGGGGGLLSAFCPTRESFCTLFGPVCPSQDVPCQSQQLGCTLFGPQCFTQQFRSCGVLSAPPRCPNPSAVDACPTRIGCPCAGGTVANPGGGLNEVAFGAAAPAVAPQKQPLTPFCNPSLQFLCQSPVAQCNPSAIDLCPTRINCDTKAPTSFCTQIAQACPTQFQLPCPTACGPNCQTQQNGCTKLHVCPPPPSPGVNCHSVIALCTNEPACINVAQPAAVGAFPPSLGIACTLPNFCPTIFQPECQTMNPETCTTVNCTQIGCPQPTPLCTQIDCTQMCPGGAVGAPQAQVAAGIALQPTLTVSCRSQFVFCPSPICHSPLPYRCPPSPLPFRCPPSPFCPSPFCPPSFGGAQCPTQNVLCQASPFPQCGGGASLGGCPSIACQQQLPQQQVGMMNPTRTVCHADGCGHQFGAQAQQRIGMTNFNCPTPETFCFVCPPDQFAMAQAQAQPAIGISQFTCPTPATRCFICPPPTFDFNCQFQAQGRLSIMCPAAPITDTTRFPCGNTNCICNA